MPSNFVSQSTLHLAIIMDGNGRWAARRGLPRIAGHRAGAESVRRVVEAAPGLGIGVLTLYAFSSDNWKRPPEEVAALMELFRRHLLSELDRLRANGVRVEIIGRRDRLPAAVEAAEAATADGRVLRLRIAVDYSARESIARAARHLAEPTTESLAALLGPPVDLLIRTGGEQRLSDFLLWECAYAELIFSERMWPDFGEQDLRAALREFTGRERRFGALPSAAACGSEPPPVRASLRA